MKRIVLTSQNYLNHTREDLLKIGFSSEQINSIIYGDQKEARLKEKEAKEVLTISFQVSTTPEIQNKDYMPKKFTTDEDLKKLNMSHEEMLKFLYYKCGYDRYVLARFTDERLGGLILKEKTPNA